MKILDLVKKIDKYLTIVEEGMSGKNLIVGNADTEIKGILISSIVDESTVDKAIATGKNVIISYSDVVFSPFNKAMAKLIKNDIALYAIKCSLDICENGFERNLCTTLGLKEKDILDITFKEKCYKLVSCVAKLEEDYASQMRAALGALGVEDGIYGAGYIGTYSQVSDCMYGHQWFVTMPGADPFIGDIGDLSKVDVERFEMIIPEHQLKECVDTICRINPYEEVEYDVYPVMETRNHKGFGATGVLVEAMGKDDFIAKIKSALGISVISVAGTAEKITKVAVCGTICSDMAEKIIAANIDAVVTGLVESETAETLKAAGVMVVLVDDFAMKMTAINKLEDYITKEICRTETLIKKPFELA